MSTTHSRSIPIVSDSAAADARAAAASDATSKRAFAANGAIASLVSVIAAGLVFWIAGLSSPWVGSNFLAAVAGTSALCLVAFGLVRGSGRSAVVAALGSCVALGLAMVAVASHGSSLAPAFAVHALTAATMEWRSTPGEKELLAWLRPWGSFHAVIVVLLYS